MNKKYLFLVLAIVCFGIGVISMGSQGTIANVVQGLGKGFGLVFYILFFILVLWEKQPLDKTPH
jgi:hypothetical protein